MSVEVEELLNARSKLIEGLTVPDFSRRFGEVIGQALQPIISGESEMVKNRPELYVLPEGATVEIPSGLDPLVAEEAQNAWQKFSTRMQDPYHFSIITAQSTVNPHTWMKFDTSVPLLQAGCATLHCLEVDGVHLPLRISVNRGKAMILPKEAKLNDDTFIDLVASLAIAFGEGDTSETEAELKANISRRHKLDKGRETLSLNLLANSPEEFGKLIDSKQFSVNPDRLMTKEEADEWLDMTAEVIKINRAGQDVVVGEPNYGSHERVRGEVNFATGLTFNRVMLNPPDASESSIQTTDFLTSVQDGDRELGFLVCSVSCLKTTGHLHVNFDHGENELFYFRQWKQRRVEKYPCSAILDNF